MNSPHYEAVFALTRSQLRQARRAKPKRDSLVSRNDLFKRRKRPKKLNCKPGYEQHGAVCKPMKNKAQQPEEWNSKETIEHNRKFLMKELGVSASEADEIMKDMF